MWVKKKVSLLGISPEHDDQSQTLVGLIADALYRYKQDDYTVSSTHSFHLKQMASSLHISDTFVDTTSSPGSIT